MLLSSPSHILSVDKTNHFDHVMFLNVNLAKCYHLQHSQGLLTFLDEVIQPSTPTFNFMRAFVILSINIQIKPRT